MSTVSPSPRIVCIGAHHMDWRVRLRGSLVAGESNPAATDIRPGGVAHNVWRGLRALGCHCELVSLPDPSNRLYMAVEHEDGSLAHGIACLDAYDALDARFLTDEQARWQHANILVVDGNCATDLFAALPDHPCIALVAVSPAKMVRLEPALDKVGWLFCNRAEHAMLVGKYALPCELKIVETRGADGLRLHHDGTIENFPAPTIDLSILDETGLGDALAACILAAIASHQTVGEPTASTGQIVAEGLVAFPSLLTSLAQRASSEP